MARMHARRRGKSGSVKPSKKIAPMWVRYKGKEIELLIVKFAKEGKTPSQIGVILRDSYGVPDVRSILKKRITDILEERKLRPEIPEDLMALIKKVVIISKHLEENKQDVSAKRGLQLIEAKIKRLVNYYKAKAKLPLDWKYDKDSIKLYVE